MFKDYYKILQINKSASQEDIKKSYRRLALIYHPDINPSEEAKAEFQEINEAYSILSDEEKRKLYDNPFQISVPDIDVFKNDNKKRNVNLNNPRVQKRNKKQGEFLNKFSYYARIAALFALLLDLLLIIDFLLPGHIEKQIIISRYSSYFPYASEYIQTKARSFSVELNASLDDVDDGKEIILEISPVFKFVNSYQCVISGKQCLLFPKVSLMKSYWFIIVIILAISIDVLFIERKKSSMIDLSMLNIFFILLLVYLITIV